MELEAVLVE